jgi:hypothetical protein
MPGMAREGRLAAVFAIAALGAVLASCAVALAEAETPSRDEYVNRLEPMCKPGAEATRRAMKGVRDDVRHKRIPIAARKFGRAAHIFGGTIKRIGRVSRPPADARRLKQWFVYLQRQQAYLEQIAAQLRTGHTIKAQRLTARFIHNGNLANNVTLAFGFDYCSFKFSRYG